MKATIHSFLLAIASCMAGQSAWAEKPADAKPALERSEDMEAALAALGYADVRVFTWRGGILQGKISFLDGKDIKPADLSAVVLGATKRLFLGEEIDARAVSGVIVIATERTGDASKGHPCRVSIALRRESVDGKDRATLRIGTALKGMLPDRGSESSESIALSRDGVRELVTPKGGKEFMLYELKVSPRPGGKGKEDKDK
jgi:hypothetical protein